jgi:hypothetical protein
MSDIKKSCKKELIKTASDRLYWYNTFGKFALSREIDDIYVLHPTSNIILVFSLEKLEKNLSNVLKEKTSQKVFTVPVYFTPQYGNYLNGSATEKQ